MLATLQCQLCLGLACNTLQSQHNLLCRLGLLVENWLSLTSVTRLLSVVTTLSLCKKGSLYRVLANYLLRASKSSYLSGLVLGDLVLGVLSAVLALAVGASGLWNVDL